MRAWLLSLPLCLVAIAAQAVEVFDDLPSPTNDAVVSLGVCTGTLIAPDVLLTAGHCIPPAWRSKAGSEVACKGLTGQLELARRARLPEAAWTDIARQPAPGPAVKFAAAPQGPGFRVPLVAYAIPHCADIALLRLSQPVPGRVAVPIPAVTKAPDRPGDWLATTRLTYKGFGATARFARGRVWRQSGHVGFWAMNRCNIFAIPPERAREGPRILRGDSGSPLLAGNGTDLKVVGVLFGSGLPDAKLCGVPAIGLPPHEGTYTPTFRGPLDDTGATDLGAWIEKMLAAAR